MSVYMIINVALLLLACIIGYHLAINNPLQGAPLSRQASCRLAHLSCAMLTLTIAWIQSPNLVVACVPPITLAGFGILHVVRKIVATRRAKKADATNDLEDATLISAVMVTSCASLSFFVTTALCRWDAVCRFLRISSFDMSIAHGLFLASLTLLLITLVQYMRFLRCHPAEAEGAQEAQDLLKRLHKPPTMQ